jgi:hypothetical protein
MTKVFFINNPMKAAFLCVLMLTSAAAQMEWTLPEGVKPETVVAVLNGTNFTAADVQKIVSAMPERAQSAFRANPKQFLRDHAWYLLLQSYAVEHKLDQKSPYRETIELSRMFTLMNAALNHAMNDIEVDPADVKKRYEQNKEKYREAKVRMIYVAFATPEAEAEAKKKAEGLVKRAREGEDFAKLVKEFSEDPGSAAQGGDPGFAVRSNSKQPPENMRKAILSAKTGEVTDALRHDNGYYIFRVESADVLPFEKVQQEIYLSIRDEKFGEWQQATKARATVQFQNEAFFQANNKEK